MLYSALLSLGSAEPAADTPGFAFLGAGYDLLQGNPLATDGLGDPGFRHNIFDWKYDMGMTTSDGKYKLADKAEARAFSDCTNDMDETIYNSAFGYKKVIDTSFDINIGLGLKNNNSVNFDLGVDVRNTRNHTDNKEEIYASASTTCSAYQLSMNMFDQADLKNDFKKGVAMMPTDFDMETYARFLTVFGTHYVSEMKVGGRWGLQMSFKSETYQALIDHHVNVHAGVKFVAGVASGGASINSTNDETTQYTIANAVYKNKTFNIGGDYSGDMETWFKSVKENPMPVHLTLNRLDEMFNKFALPDEDPDDLKAKKSNLVKAIDGWCDYQATIVEGFDCSPQEDIPMPTPTPIGDDSIRRVCVKCEGGFEIQWHMVSPSGLDATTDKFPSGKTECLDGTDVMAKQGDELGGKVDVTGHPGGQPIPLGKPWKQYNEQSTLQANYKCTGTSLAPKCTFVSVSRIGVNPEYTRRRRTKRRLMKQLA